MTDDRITACPRCEADPQPQNFGSPRNCAFKRDRLADGSMLIVPSDYSFTPDNWQCATMTALIDAYDRDRKKVIYGHDESMNIIPCDPDADSDYGGWIVLTRYKSRGKVSSAVHVGDFYPPRPLTVALAEATITFLQRRQREDEQHARR